MNFKNIVDFFLQKYKIFYYLLIKIFSFVFKNRSQKQVSIFDFHTEFESKLDPENRRVKMAKMLHWRKLADVYAQSLSSDLDAGNIDARVIIRAFIIKDIERKMTVIPLIPFRNSIDSKSRCTAPERIALSAK